METKTKMTKTKKKKDQNTRTSSQPSSQPWTSFGASALHIGGADDDGASHLVGSIVEKGVSDFEPRSKPYSSPIAPPKPSPLPFPVARHRSHGPHWAPIGCEASTGCGGDDGDDEEDDASMEFDQMASFANPVERRSRKAVDFSDWRELLSGTNNNTSVTAEKPEKRKKSNNKPSYVSDMELDYSNKEHVGHIDVEMGDCGNGVKRREANILNRDGDSSGTSFGGEHEALSLEGQIDAENRARLLGMSPEEIAEAKAEIAEKMDPSLLRLLKRRGEQKLKKEKSLSSDIEASAEAKGDGQKNEEGNGGEGLSIAGISTACEETKETSKDVQGGLDNGEERTPNPGSSGLWSAWSKRVEGSRGLRFSLDGLVVESDIASVVETNSVAERDFLRTEGDPGGAGYTIKEAVALTRSVVPGQRALALHILFSVLDNAVRNICLSRVGCSMGNIDEISGFTDWEAIWAYSLGPEPELVLSLRMCLDDNHNSVVLACTKVIQCILTCDLNENFFDVSEKATVLGIFTAPVFRSRPELDVGFLHGGYWKYSAKSSNILNLDEDIIDDETGDKHTIRDDITIAGQDFAAGLVRMGILPRLRYLLESDPTAVLEECVVSILVAVARHSPTCATAVMNCQRLIETVIQRFTTKDSVKIHPSSIKSVCLIKVLAQSDRKHCLEFLKSGTFLIISRNLFKCHISLDQWVKYGKENCKLYSSLIVEQLRFWKVCIQHGYCVSYFSDIFTSLCLWLKPPPSVEKLIENNVFGEYASITAESYLVLEALAKSLPNFFSQMNPRNQIEEHGGDNNEVWSWSQVTPMVDSALQWIILTGDLHSHNFWQSRSDHVSQDPSMASFLWVFASVMNMLSAVLKRIIPADNVNSSGGLAVPWLPEFVPKLGLEIVKNRFLNFSVDTEGEFATDVITCGSFVKTLCHLRRQNEYQTSLASVCCLQGLVSTVVGVDNLIHSAKKGIVSTQEYNPAREERILRDGIINSSLVELRGVHNNFTDLIASEWQVVRSIETFGRGGPAPGVGVGWGASGGGYWSASVLLAHADARLIVDLVETLQVLNVSDSPRNRERTSAAEIINSSLAACLISGPRGRNIVNKAFKGLTHVSVLKYLDLATRKFLSSNSTFKPFDWEYKEDDYLAFSNILTSHFSDRWLLIKKKLKTADYTSNKKTKGSLDTIYEDSDTSNTIQISSSVEEWAHQRLPLPVTWFLSPISTLCDSKYTGLQKRTNLENIMQNPGERVGVSKAGLFFLLGIESMSSFLRAEIASTVHSVPLVWKLHSLSVILLVGMDAIEDNKSRDVYEALQNIYGDALDKARFRSAEMTSEENKELLRFKSEIHDSYLIFVETLVDQFSAISYGDLIYGRQVAIYLHQCVETPVRLAAWNALSNARVLELLPPLESCVGEVEGYLHPVEDNADILEAYVKSWTCGALDRAANRSSVAYTLVLHHLSHFIFRSAFDDKHLLRNKLARSFLRDISVKKQREDMMLSLLRYDDQARSHTTNARDSLRSDIGLDKRLEVLTEACERNSSLLNEVKKLKAIL